ncbi:MAG TPA: HAD-IC family P-type ATPase, partial [Candidatus Dormibacteraeota bacterium]
MTCAVAHRTPTRVRLRIDPGDAPVAASLASRLSAHPDVDTVRWSPASRSLVVQHRRGCRLEEIAASAPAAGEQQPSPPPEPAGQSLWRQMLLPAASMAAGVMGVTPLAPLVVAGCAAPIARRAIRSLGGGHVSVDVLDTAAAAILLGRGDLLAAGVGVGLVEVGERIRSRAAGRARSALRGWLGEDSRGVRVLGEGTEPRVPADQVRPGDRVVVYAGETIPVDGVVLAGEGLIDTRTWTGEPGPRRVGKGGDLLAGAAVHDGRLVIEVRAAGRDTRGARLAAALEETLAAQTRVSDVARRIADRTVLPVLLLGGAVFAVTRDLSRLASMLIVDFGTGVRIAIPTAVLSAIVAGAREGILFRSGRALEELAAVDSVVFDKTGTLTTGRPTVVAVDAVAGHDGDEVLRLAAAAEGHLPHPFARAIRRAARREGLQPPEPLRVRHRAGGGVLADIEGHTVLVGDRRLLGDEGVDCPPVGSSGSLA